MRLKNGPFSPGIHFVAVARTALAKMADVLRARLGAAKIHLGNCPDYMKEVASRTQAAAFLDDLASVTLTSDERFALLSMATSVPFAIGDDELVAYAIASKQSARSSKPHRRAMQNYMARRDYLSDFDWSF